MSTLTATSLPLPAEIPARATPPKAGWKNIFATWSLLVTFVYGSVELWLGVLSAVIAARYFPGATPLLVFGSCFPFFRGDESARLALDRDLSLERRSRFTVLALIALANAVPNAIAIGWAAGLQVGGAVPWTVQDTWTSVVAIVAFIIIAKRWGIGNMWSDHQARFYWVVSWRTITILALAWPPLFVPGAIEMPLRSAVGLMLIGLVALGIISMQITSKGFRKLRWLFWAEVANSSASIILLITLLVT